MTARYGALNQAWIDSAIPPFVLQTPDWRSGWDVLLDWVCSKTGDSNRNWSANLGSLWAKEIHIFSHVLQSSGGHSNEHAALEEEGMRAILAWWKERTERDK